MYIGKDIPQPYYMGMQSLIGFASSEITNNRENLLMQSGCVGILPAQGFL
jgi:hypothetical protein